jgi:hypothetical protein
MLGRRNEMKTKKTTKTKPASKTAMLPKPPYEIGKCYLIRTVTYFSVGRLVGVHPTELVLADASWVADTGRFNQALASGVLNEVEPIPGGHLIVGRGAVVDAMFWNHALPAAVK